jgi:hypothetical protein
MYSELLKKDETDVLWKEITHFNVTFYLSGRAV